MSQTIAYDFDALQTLQKGIQKLAHAVKITLGPKGQNVVIDREQDNPLITNDGVTIAKAIHFENPLEDIGAKLLKSVSIKTNDLAGDGTTTACVLAEKMIQEGIKNYMAGAHPLHLRNGMKKAVQVVVEYLDSIAIDVKSPKEIHQIASISAGSDEVGQLISQAFASIGTHGTITIANSQTTKTECQIVEGMSFDKGYLSPYFCNQVEKMQTEFENPFLFLCAQPILKIQDLLPVLELASQHNKPLCMIVSDIDDSVLQALIINKLRGTLNVVCIKAPEFGDRQRAVLEDIAVLTGGKVLAEDHTETLQNMQLSYLGNCDKITVTKDQTIIVGGKANDEQLQQRVAMITKQIEQASTTFDQFQLEQRLAKLTGGVAVIKVGGYTDIEQNELRLRIEDSIHATKSATQEGIVPGGGMALLQARDVVKNLLSTLDGDEKTGAMIIYQSLLAPFYQICSNAMVDGEVIMEKIRHSSLPNAGYDAKNNQIVDMLTSGIIDPKKVTRCALENACSVASTILTTKVVMTV